MRSLADPRTSGRSREPLEFVLRMAALFALVGAELALTGVLRPSAASGVPAPTEYVYGNEPSNSQVTLPVTVVAMAMNDRMGALHLRAGAIPSDTGRAILSAANNAGMHVTWSESAPQRPLALEATALLDPRGGVSVRTSAPPGTRLAIADSVGVIDTITSGAGGGALTIGKVAGSISVAATGSQTGSETGSETGSRATVVAPLPVEIRHILLLAEPGWEAKFTLAALEERGWTVDAQFSVAPRVVVTQGTPMTPDTARYAAIIVLDSSGRTQAAALRRYVQQGGGLIVAGSASTLRELQALLPGRAGNRQLGVPGALQTTTPFAGLAWRPIASDSTSVVILRDQRGAPNVARGGAGVIAWRYGNGRVLQVAYDGLWEWRMLGTDGSVDAHRAWWTQMVGLVAFAPEDTLTAAESIERRPGNAAPLADLTSRIGVAGTMPSVLTPAGPARPWAQLLFVVALVALMLEWASRRLRGER